MNRSRLLMLAALLATVALPWRLLHAQEAAEPAAAEVVTEEAPEAAAPADAEPAAPAADAGAEAAPPEEPPPPPPPPPEEFKPVQVWAGAVLRGELTAEPQRWRDFAGLLLDGKLRPEDKDERPTVERAPSEERLYAILTVQVFPGKSIGKYDYTLRTPQGDVPCLAMRYENDPFDPRLYEIKYLADQPFVQLAYEVTPDLRDTQLVAALPMTLLPPPVPLRLLAPAAAE
jgi:hypothetical protein